MTRKARALGMRNTTYRNANGLPNDDQITTARDQALLGIAIQERFPKYYRYFSLASFVYRGNAMRNHNHLLGKVEGVDGIKTGFTRDSGFNLVASVRRGPRRIVAVVLGGRSAGSRDAKMRELIEANIDDASTKPGAALVAEAKPERRGRPQLSVCRARARFRSAQRSRAKSPRRFRRAPPRRSLRSRSRPSWSNSSRRRTRPSRSRNRCKPPSSPRRPRMRRWQKRSRQPPRSAPRHRRRFRSLRQIGRRQQSGCSRQAAGHDGRRQGSRHTVGQGRTGTGRQDRGRQAFARPQNTSHPRLPATPSAAAGPSRSAPMRTKARPSNI